MTNSKLAILSPSSNAYSETFIQSHRKLNNGNIAFYYGGLGEIKLDGFGSIQGVLSKSFWRLFGRIFGKEKYDIHRSLRKTFKKNRVGAILLEYGNFAAEVLPHLHFFKGKIIVHFHGYDASMYSVLDKYSTAYKQMSEKVEKMVVVSEVMKNTLINLGIPKNKIILNIYGPHIDFLNVKPSYDSKQLLFIGRFVNKKAPYYLVNLMKEVIRVNPDVKLIMIGDGPLMQVVRDLIRYHKLESHVLLKGILSREEILLEMSRSAVYIQHSVRSIDGDMEGTPNTILEACAASLPIISTKHAGIPDVVVDQETGFLVEEHDVEAMIAHVLRIIDDPNYLNRIGEEGRKRIQNNLSQSRYLSELDKMLL